MSDTPTFLMAEKHALENELEAMTAKALGWQQQAELDAKLLVDCREKAERYRLEANAMMAQRDEAQRKVAELQAGLDDIEEYGTEEINAAVDLRHQLAAALRERAEARGLARNLYWAGYDLRRFARAYANDYDEADGKEGAIQADLAFYEASKDLAEKLGEENAK